MKEIFNPSSGVREWIINEDEKELIDIALHNLAVSTGNSSLASARGVDHE